MTSLLVVAEHREGKLTDVTLEMLGKAKILAEQLKATVMVGILGSEIQTLAEELAIKGADEAIAIFDKRLSFYNQGGYRRMLHDLIAEKKPILTLIGHTAQGIDFAPSLANALNLPLATDCVELRFEEESLVATRQMYNSRIEVDIAFPWDKQYLATVRPGVFSPPEQSSGKGRIIRFEAELKDEDLPSKVVGYLKPEAHAGEVDITKAEVIVSVGRGIGSQENLKTAEELAQALGGVVACSRPVMDKGWLPEGRQVGTSGKTVKPKLYVALGISGATQHVAGIKGGGTIIAVNKDSSAPILRISDYAIIDDLTKVIPIVTKKLRGK